MNVNGVAHVWYLAYNVFHCYIIKSHINYTLTPEFSLLHVYLIHVVGQFQYSDKRKMIKSLISMSI